MPNKRTSKTSDLDQFATEILEEAVGKPAPITPRGRNNPAAAKSPRAGGLKGGAVKAKGASPKTRKAAARNSPAARAKSK